MSDAHDILQQYWHYDSFRPMQKEIIDSVLGGHDTLALLPTGGGKSLCYQVPALAFEGLTLVVSPLIALMKDQVTQLRKRHIKAYCITSSMTKRQIEIVLNHCLHDDVKLLYVSPERLKSLYFLSHLREMRINLIAVDEAHCISQWGYDFRPSYLEIAKIRAYHPKAPIVALTATATPEVVSDIVMRLEFRNGNTFRGSFFRPNLSYSVLNDNDKIGRLMKIVRNVGGSGIIYVRNRRRTQEIATLLEDAGINAMAYHAGLEQKERDMKQQTWQQTQGAVMVATNAFGMGIDKPDVRFVVHMDIPNSPEAYFQEAGRAGRDGKRAFAVLLYNPSDIEQLHYELERDFPTLKYIKNVYRGICNYYQVPIGSGQDSRFDFEAEAICKTYGFDLYAFFKSVQFLDREGLVSTPERNELESRLHIPISKEELYRFQVENRQAGDLLTVILRLYGGLFADYIPILESQIARRYGCKETVVSDMLMQMHKQQIVDYQRKTTKPQIIFTSPRVEIDDLHLGDYTYRELKNHAQKRLQAMLDYVANDGECRSLQLQRYFGEESDTRCECCDVCIAQRKKQQQTEEASLEETILQKLKEHSMTVRELSAALPQENVEKLSDCIRKMLDQQHIRMNDWVLSPA